MRGTVPRRRSRNYRWYERFGIEPPFPWLGILIWSVPVLGAAAVLAAQVLVMLYGGDRLVEHMAHF